MSETNMTLAEVIKLNLNREKRILRLTLEIEIYKAEAEAAEAYMKSLPGQTGDQSLCDVYWELVDYRKNELK